MSNYKDRWPQCETIIHSKVALKEKMQAICDLLGTHMPVYDWVGFYLSDVKNKKLHYSLTADSWDNKELLAISKVVKSNRFTMGKNVKKFENNFSKYIGSKITFVLRVN